MKILVKNKNKAKILNLFYSKFHHTPKIPPQTQVLEHLLVSIRYNHILNTFAGYIFGHTMDRLHLHNLNCGIKWAMGCEEPMVGFI